MKHSLATIRKATAKRRRRRPRDFSSLQDGESQNGHTSTANGPRLIDDKRAIKKATSLALDGCVSKAPRVINQEITPRTLSDSETIEKLRALHPDLPTTFRFPQDAPMTACITPIELREA